MGLLNINTLDYNTYKEKEFRYRYININLFYAFLQSSYSDNISLIGYSVLNNPIYKFHIGEGDINILCWTQMHGNESTGSLACLDLLNYLKDISSIESKILNKISLDIIFILNPDGAMLWERRNAMGIDINRDFNAEQSPEIRVLKKQFFSKKYHVCFNLHDQRTIFNVGATKSPATLSFLSPSINVDKSINDTHKKSMGIIAHIFSQLQTVLPNAMSRFSDEFYPNSTGDNFQLLGSPTLLFETGHYPNDYTRNAARKFLFYALLTAIDYISDSKDWQENYKLYETIPNNNTLLYDIIIRNIGVSYNGNHYYTNVAIQYKEKLNNITQEIDYIPFIEEIGDLKLNHGLKEININKEIVLINEQLKIGQNAENIFAAIVDFI